MDLNDIKNQVSNLTLYDLKAGWRKAQNAVMNYTEMEAKVREATNNEPWGASTSSMQEIANGTFNYAQLNEIMPLIYKRFTEKSAEEWRQIYKALQLLEFLIKNGSERVIDDARGHLSLLKMLRQFHYIDQNGKDQGINVRNRAKELAELLGDVERIRTERKKARTTRNKYGGVEGGASRYGGFSSESASGGRSNYGGFSGGVYGDGGGFGGEAGDDYTGTQSHRDRFEEYDEYDEGSAASRRPAASSAAAPKRTAAKAEPPKPKEPEVDLFDFGDDDIAPPAASNGKKPAPATSNTDDFGDFSGATGGDDDFDDFQSAGPATTTAKPAAQPSFQPLAPPPQTSSNAFIAPPPASGSVNYSAFNAPPAQTVTSPSAGFQQAPPTTAYQAAQPNYFGSVSAGSGTATPTQQHQRNASAAGAAAMSTQRSATPKTAGGADPFASLMSGLGPKKTSGPQKQSMADMAKQKASAGLWGPPAGQTQPQGGSGGDDLI